MARPGGDERFGRAALDPLAPGPVLLAAVVTREALDSQAVLKRCHASLGPKTPRHLVRLDQLPRNANGKLLRQVLQERTKVGAARSAPASTAGTTPSTH